MNAHKEALEIERDRAYERFKSAGTSGASFEEYRMRQREYEQLEHRLEWFRFAPRTWID